ARFAIHRVVSSGCTLLRSPHELTVRLGMSVNGMKVSAATASLCHRRRFFLAISEGLLEKGVHRGASIKRRECDHADRLGRLRLRLPDQLVPQVKRVNVMVQQ